MNTLPFEVHVIPAEPGWYTVLMLDDGDGDPLILNDPVLAWAMRISPQKDQKAWEAPIVNTSPITHHGLEESQLYGYQDPRGKILEIEGNSYVNLAEANKHYIAAQKERLQGERIAKGAHG